MKKRVFNVMNFLALNVLFFALYLNFIHKDVNTLPAVSASSNIIAKNAVSYHVNTPLPASQQHKDKNTSN